MAWYRGYVIALIACVVVETALFYGLVGIGVNDQLVATIELIWLCATVLITLTVGDRFERKERGRGD
jgi:hypothetical protein